MVKVDRPNVNATATRQARWMRETRVRSVAAAVVADAIRRNPGELINEMGVGTHPGRNWPGELKVDRVLLYRLMQAVEKARPGLVGRARDAIGGANQWP